MEIKRYKRSHYQYIHEETPGKVTIPNYNGDLPNRTIKSILKQPEQPGWYHEINLSIVFYENVKNGSCTVVVPDLPGCTTFGNNLSKEIENGKDAACSIHNLKFAYSTDACTLKIFYKLLYSYIDFLPF